MLAVCGIRAVPLHAGVVEATANVRRHRHETTVRAISRHTFMFWIIREVDLRTVGVRGCACHAVVAFIQKHQGFFHGLYALRGVGNASVDHVLLRQPNQVNLSTSLLTCAHSLTSRCWHNCESKTLFPAKRPADVRLRNLRSTLCSL